MSQLVGYFGYGSLVNRDTLRTDFIGHKKASLKGWCRHWSARVTDLDPPITLLSVHRSPETSIRGMLVIDKAENLAAVDEREEGYDRVRLELSDLDFPNEDRSGIPKDLFVYVGRKQVEEGEVISQRHQLLQSYIDAVLQGFYREYGSDGVRHFVETTKSFDRILKTDRQNPEYPRAVKLTVDELELIDKTVLSAGAVIA